MGKVYVSQPNAANCTKTSTVQRFSILFSRSKSLLQFTFLLLLGSLLVANTVSAQTATVQTDLLDYPPGATAIITGTGWTAGETVNLQVLHVDGNPLGTDPQHHQPFTTVADATGNISSSWFVPNDGDAVGARGSCSHRRVHAGPGLPQGHHAVGGARRVHDGDPGIYLRVERVPDCQPTVQ